MNQIIDVYNESTVKKKYKITKTTPKIIKDCKVSFLVNLDFGGFRTKINTNIKDQKRNNINHPIMAAYKKSFIIHLN